MSKVIDAKNKFLPIKTRKVLELSNDIDDVVRKHIRADMHPQEVAIIVSNRLGEIIALTHPLLQQEMIISCLKHTNSQLKAALERDDHNE